MFLTLLTLLATQAFAGPIEIKVTDPNVVKLELTCGSNTRQIPVSNGFATLPDLPGKCQVAMIIPSGEINGPGKYACSVDGCTLAEIDHKPITDGPGIVNVILAPGVVGSSIEMNCPNGLRTRAIIERNTAIFESVPEIQCNIMVKGGPPLRFSGITSGTYTCMSSNSSLICTKH